MIYNLGNTGVRPFSAYQWTGLDKVTVIEYVLDLSRRSGNNVPPGGYVTGDQLNLFDLPEGILVQAASYEVITAEGAAATFAYGDGAVSTYWGTGISLNTVVGPVLSAGAVKVYGGANSYMRVTLGGTLSAQGGAAKVAFHFLVANMTTGGAQ